MPNTSQTLLNFEHWLSSTNCLWTSCRW